MSETGRRPRARRQSAQKRRTRAHRLLPSRRESRQIMEPLLTSHIREANGFTLDAYTRRGGYGAIKKALGMTPDAVIDVVKQSGLRGRGGAGFPTGMKWQFVDKKSPKPKYICCNAD